MKAIFFTLIMALFFYQSSEKAQTAFISTAKYNISGDGYSNTIAYNSNENLIFIQLFQNNEMWIRLAEEKEENGENGSHIDIDICNYLGSGNYSPIDAQVRPCTESGWDIWLHDNDKVYFNQKNSSPCNLVVTQNADTLVGVFNCDNIKLKDGEGLVNITDGEFKALITHK